MLKYMKNIYDRKIISGYIHTLFSSKIEILLKNDYQFNSKLPAVHLNL